MPDLRFIPDLQPPKPSRRPQKQIHHAIESIDDYAWLRADNWQAVFQDASLLDTEIRTHLDAENAYAQAQMADTQTLQSQLFDEMKGRIKEADESVPMPHGDFYYGSAFVIGAEHPQFYRFDRDSIQGKPTILLDADKEAIGKDYFNIGGASHSHDHKHMLWAYDDNGSEYYKIRVRDLDTLDDLNDRIENSAGDGAWNAKGDGFYYTKLNENHRPNQVYYHALGTSQDNDLLIYEETDTAFFMDVSSTLLNDYVIIEISNHETSEVRLIDAVNEASKPRISATRCTGVEYSLENGGDVWFVLTNVNKAQDFKIMTTPIDAPEQSNWTELIEHKPGRLILSVIAYAQHLTWLERENGLPRIAIMDRNTHSIHYIEFDEDAYSLGMLGTYEFYATTLRFSYSSMSTPRQTFDYDMISRNRTLLKTQEIPSGHVIEDYKTQRIMVPSYDGALVPVSLLMRANTKLDGSNPCLLEAYGAYGISIPAAFNSNDLSLVDRGFIIAIAHVRGGKDKGGAWYEQGKLKAKINTFKDYIAVAQYLADHKYTLASKLIAQGGSAGGMLIGAVANMAPQLFGGMIAQVPFVDVLNTMLDDTLPLTPPEWPEWGNPIDDLSDYINIASYCPYNNVSTLPYPPILALSGLTDPRVTYWEPTKWVARLRENSTSTHQVILKTNMEAGHGGASGRFAQLEEVAYCYAFAIKVASL